MSPRNYANINSLFQNLIREIDLVIAEMKKLQSGAMGDDAYTLAEEMLGRIKKVAGIRKKSSELLDEWKIIDLPENNSIAPSVNTPVSRTYYGRSPIGAKNPIGKFYVPILESLLEMNRSGRVSDVLAKVENKMSGVLNDTDYQHLPSDGKPRWQKTANWARYKMVGDGLLRSDSRRGIWEISPKGKEYLRKQGN